MVEAASNLKLLPKSFFNICKVFEHIDMHAVHGHVVAATQNYNHTTCLIFWGSTSLIESQ
jgi:hypothetical protein